VPEVIKAVRDDFAKVPTTSSSWWSGGVASSPIRWRAWQYPHRRIEAAVEERTVGAVMSAPTPTARARFRRAVKLACGRSSTGNLIDAPTAALMAEKGAYIVADAGRLRRAETARPDYGLSSTAWRERTGLLDAGLRSSSYTAPPE